MAAARRRWLSAAAAGIGASMTPMLARGASPERLVATPAQTTGPFYPVDWSGDVDHDLVVVRGQAARSLGQVAHVRGRVLDRDGRPLDGAFIEIWQCDANGRYLHPADRGGAGRDPRFQGRGRTRAAADGSYAFRTIRPVAYSGRAPHIHFSVQAPDGSQLVTQLYVAGDPHNARDFLLNAIRDPRQRDAVLVPFVPAERLEPGALFAQFDLVLQARPS